MAVHAIARDITRQKEAEERLRESEAKYRSLIERAAFGIYTSTEDGRILEANPAMARMLGYDSPCRADDARAWRTCISRRLNGRRSSRSTGISRAAPPRCAGNEKTASRFSCRVTATKMEVAPGEQERYETIAEDVTDLRALEEQLRQAQKMEAVGRLARGVAHDFNNVLAAIVGASELLARSIPRGPSDATRSGGNPESRRARRRADEAAARVQPAAGLRAAGRRSTCADRESRNDAQAHRGQCRDDDASND